MDEILKHLIEDLVIKLAKQYEMEAFDSCGKENIECIFFFYWI